MITVACVRSGDKYPIMYVKKLQNMVRRFLPVNHRFICLTDRPERVKGIEFKNISDLKLPEWWGKLALFNPDIRGFSNCIYFDLDTVIVGDLTPLLNFEKFQICQNFTKLSGHAAFPCNFGSCVMTFPKAWGEAIWKNFIKESTALMSGCKYGDQQVIEKLINKTRQPFFYLQETCPRGFFVGRRDFTGIKPKEASVMVFAGRHKPHNTPYVWLKEAWK